MGREKAQKGSEEKKKMKQLHDDTKEQNGKSKKRNAHKKKLQNKEKAAEKYRKCQTAEDSGAIIAFPLIIVRRSCAHAHTKCPLSGWSLLLLLFLLLLLLCEVQANGFHNFSPLTLVAFIFRWFFRCLSSVLHLICFPLLFLSFFLLEHTLSFNTLRFFFVLVSFMFKLPTYRNAPNEHIVMSLRMAKDKEKCRA